ncbi:hypothetical protein [Draconibacterium sediminis]|uniref:Uncharacterized protein n=1 Tax=Draconibacterium sediminis TaxID=1544798 RepID=A0A0D8JBB2_9BACT|nr:hypothetical protein [Draconibacterium sediminis]KJF44260.1 hypothetical protein LH29_01715 [Draconibacterium sediminis]
MSKKFFYKNKVVIIIVSAFVLIVIGDKLPTTKECFEYFFPPQNSEVLLKNIHNFINQTNLDSELSYEQLKLEMQNPENCKKLYEQLEGKFSELPSEYDKFYNEIYKIDTLKNVFHCDEKLDNLDILIVEIHHDFRPYLEKFITKDYLTELKKVSNYHYLSIISNLISRYTLSQSVDELNTIYKKRIDLNEYFRFPIRDGFIPYEEFNDYNQIALGTNNSITFKNTNDRDAIIFLCLPNSNRVIKNIYVNKGNNYTMHGIANGVYFLKVAFGNNFNPEKNNFNQTIVGGFEKNVSFQTFANSDDWFSFKNDLTQYEVTLFAVENGNLEGKTISENDFFTN